MKIAFRLLSVALAICIGIILLLNYRQSEATAQTQARYDALLRENRELKIALQKKAATGSALTSARAIAARYQNDPKLIKRTAQR